MDKGRLHGGGSEAHTRHRSTGGEAAGCCRCGWWEEAGVRICRCEDARHIVFRNWGLHERSVFAQPRVEPNVSEARELTNVNLWRSARGVAAASIAQP